MRKNIVFILAACLSSSASYAQKYVALDGNDDNPGTLDKPYKTIARAVISSSPQDTLFVRGGIHEMSASVSIGSARSGTAYQPRVLCAFPGERPLLDFSKTSDGVKGFYLKASWWHIAGFDVKGAGDNGMQISEGSNNLIERCAFFENRDSGLQLDAGASNNRIVDCDSYHNADPPDYGDADGFAPKLTVGSGNAFAGCRSWGNCDDGWDGYMRGASGVTTTLENCWTWGNGYLKDGRDPGSQANGNGFKMGGGDNSNSQNLMHHFILKNCLAFGNKNKGFDQNNNVGSMTLLNCTGYKNKAANFRITKALVPGQKLTLMNCVSFEGGVELGGFAVQEKNSWMPPFTVTAGDFQSLDFAALTAPRNADGSLPDIAFLRPSPGSDLVDAGVFCGLPYTGAAPDLGAFESTGTAVASGLESKPADFELQQNYPNPCNPQTTIRFCLSRTCLVSLKVYDSAGRETAVLADGFQNAGTHKASWHPERLPGGIYIARLQTEGFSRTIKLVLQK